MNDGTALLFDEVLHETENAFLIEFEPGVEEWMPKSQCDITDIRGVECIIVPVWLAEEKGIEIYEYEW